MDANTLSGLISSFGLPITLLVYYILDSKKKDEKMEVRMDTQISKMENRIGDENKKHQEQITKMETENKEDKKMFMAAIETFNKTIDSIGDIKADVNDVKTEVAEVNIKVDQILLNKKGIS